MDKLLSLAKKVISPAAHVMTNSYKTGSDHNRKGPFVSVFVTWEDNQYLHVVSIRDTEEGTWEKTCKFVEDFAKLSPEERVNANRDRRYGATGVQPGEYESFW